MEPVPIIGLGNQIRKRRREWGFTQGELAKHLGTSNDVVSKWETGSAEPSEAMLDRLSIWFSMKVPKNPLRTHINLKRMIRKRRELWNLSPNSLAKRLGVGRNTVVAWEEGSTPSPAKMELLNGWLRAEVPTYLSGRDPDVGSRIKETRLRWRMTQVELAEYLEISPATVLNWENGHTQPSNYWLYRLDKWFDETAYVRPDRSGRRAKCGERLGNQIRRRRTEWGKSQAELAEELDFTPGDVARWEQGVLPQHDSLRRIENWLSVSPPRTLVMRDESLGGRIERRRIEWGMTRPELGAFLGVGGVTVLKWERGTLPNWESMRKLGSWFAKETPHLGDRGLGDRIRLHRRALGISQDDCAAQLGVSRNLLRRWEKGAKILPKDVSLITEWLGDAIFRHEEEEAYPDLSRRIMRKRRDMGLSWETLARHFGVRMQDLIEWALGKTPDSDSLVTIEAWLTNVPTRGALKRDETLGVNVRRMRKEKGISVPELALHLGVNPSSVLRWELGAIPRKRMFRKIEDWFEGRTIVKVEASAGNPSVGLSCRLRQQREAMGITQSELASRLGFHARDIQRWERGTYPTPDNLRLLEEWLSERSPEHILARDGTLGGLIRQRRIEWGMTQEELAEEIRVSNGTVSKWELGAIPRLGAFGKIERWYAKNPQRSDLKRDESLGARIRVRREEWGKTREELAVRLNVSHSTLSSWESGTIPRPGAFKRIEDWFSEVPPSNVLRRDGSLAENLRQKREAFGMTPQELAQQLDVDTNVVIDWEAGVIPGLRAYEWLVEWLSAKESRTI